MYALVQFETDLSLDTVNMTKLEPVVSNEIIRNGVSVFALWDRMIGSTKR